jgi:hypothetical protein
MKPSLQETTAIPLSTPQTFTHWQQRILLILLLTAGFFLIRHNVANAQPLAPQIPQSCSLVYGFDGVYNTSGWGSQAIIGGYQPASVCNASSNWVMVNNTNDYHHAYDQIGYIRYAGQPGPTNENRYFTEYQDATGSGGPIFTDLGEDTSYWGGSSDTFSVYYDTGVHLFKILLNNGLLGEADLNWSPNDRQWFDETHATADHVLGGYNHHTVFANVLYLQNGAWHAPNTGTNEGNPKNPNGGFASGSDKFYVWDTRYS